MYAVKRDVPAFTVNTGKINIQVDKATSQENLAIVAGMPEYAGLIEEAQAPEKENKTITKKNQENEK